MRTSSKHDKIFLGIVGITLVFGLFVFVSAALSVLAEDSSLFYRTLFNQLVLGLVGGGIAFYLSSRIEYKIWKRYALGFFIVSLLATLLVFIPGLGFEHGGARRWLNLGPISFQPAELLKLGFVIYWAAWLSWVKTKVTSMKWGLIPFIVLSAITAGILLLQPDTGTVLVILLAGGIMFFVAGAKWRDIAILLVLGLVGFGALIAVRPYVLDRVTTFLDPTHDPLGSSYQIQQSLIAVGSGKIVGRGYGQSVQKFNYLPEPAGDSVFAVMSEELGFIGAIVLLLLILGFVLRGYRIAQSSRTMFGTYVVVGLVTLIVSQSFLNIGSALGVLPLTGLPLIFVSQGGTALLFALFEVGIIVNISKYRKL